MTQQEQDEWMVLGCLAGLAVCILLHGLAIARIRRDLEFVTVIAEKRMTDV